VNKNLIFILIIALAVAVGFSLYSQNSQKGKLSNVDVISPESVEGNSVIVVLNEQNDSGESGTATLVEKDGKAVVTLNMTGAPTGVVQPSHIHSGDCANTGAILYPLEYPVDGKSVTTLPVGFSELKAQMPLLVNVHKSTILASIYVSCGELEL
jgi:Cu/Zn superoxide dismutase